MQIISYNFKENFPLGQLCLSMQKPYKYSIVGDLFNTTIKIRLGIKQS